MALFDLFKRAKCRQIYVLVTQYVGPSKDTAEFVRKWLPTLNVANRFEETLSQSRKKSIPSTTVIRFVLRVDFINLRGGTELEKQVLRAKWKRHCTFLGRLTAMDRSTNAPWMWEELQLLILKQDLTFRRESSWAWGYAGFLFPFSNLALEFRSFIRKRRLVSLPGQSSTFALFSASPSTGQTESPSFETVVELNLTCKNLWVQ